MLLKFFWLVSTIFDWRPCCFAYNHVIFGSSLGVHEHLPCSYRWRGGLLVEESLTFSLIRLSCNLVFIGEDFDLLSYLRFIKRGPTWLDFDHLRLCCLTSSTLPIFKCPCLGLIFGVQLLSRHMLVEVEHPCVSLGDHLKTLMNTWGWPGVTLVALFDVYGWLSLET